RSRVRFAARGFPPIPPARATKWLKQDARRAVIPLGGPSALVRLTQSLPLNARLTRLRRLEPLRTRVICTGASTVPSTVFVIALHCRELRHSHRINHLLVRQLGTDML